MTKIPNSKPVYDLEFGKIEMPTIMVLILGHWILKFVIYPSTLLRVVSLSNHLIFGACYLIFLLYEA